MFTYLPCHRNYRMAFWMDYDLDTMVQETHARFHFLTLRVLLHVINQNIETARLTDQEVRHL